MAASNVVENMIVRLMLDPSRLFLAGRQTESRLNQMANNLARIGTRFSLAFTLPITAGVAKVAHAFADFDDAMTRSMAIADDATAAIRKQMEANAIAISRVGRTSVIDLAKSYHTLIAAGQTAQQSLKSLATIEKFAVAGMMEMESATSQLVDSMFALGKNSPDAIKNAKNMGDLANMLSYAAQLTNASEEQLAKTIRTRAGAASRAFGVPMEELFGVMSVYAQQGIKGEFAGEQIYIFLRDMQAAALKNQRAFKLMNVEVYDRRGELKQLPVIVRSLEKALAGMSDRSKKATLAFLGFTDRSIAATYNLLGTSRTMMDFTKKYEDTSPTALADKYAKMMESFAAQMKNLKNNIEIFAVEVGRTLAPAIGFVVEKIKMMTTWFGRLSEFQKKTILWIAGIAAITGPVLLITAAFAKLMLVAGLFFIPVMKLATAFGILDIGAGVFNTALASIGRMLRGDFSGLMELGNTLFKVFKAVVGFMYNIDHNLKIIGMHVKQHLIDAFDWAMDRISDRFFNFFGGTRAGTQNAAAALTQHQNVRTHFLKGFIMGVPGGPLLMKALGIEEFAEGGEVPGPAGKPKIIMAHGGEYVVPRGKQFDRLRAINQQSKLVVDRRYIPGPMTRAHALAGQMRIAEHEAVGRSIDIKWKYHLALAKESQARLNKAVTEAQTAYIRLSDNTAIDKIQEGLRTSGRNLLRIEGDLRMMELDNRLKRFEEDPTGIKHIQSKFQSSLKGLRMWGQRAGKELSKFFEDFLGAGKPGAGGGKFSRSVSMGSAPPPLWAALLGGSAIGAGGLAAKAPVAPSSRGPGYTPGIPAPDPSRQFKFGLPNWPWLQKLFAPLAEMPGVEQGEPPAIAAMRAKMAGMSGRRAAMGDTARAFERNKEGISFSQFRGAVVGGRALERAMDRMGGQIGFRQARIAKLTGRLDFEKEVESGGFNRSIQIKRLEDQLAKARGDKVQKTEDTKGPKHTRDITGVLQMIERNQRRTREQAAQFAGQGLQPTMSGNSGVLGPAGVMAAASGMGIGGLGQLGQMPGHRNRGMEVMGIGQRILGQLINIANQGKIQRGMFLH